MGARIDRTEAWAALRAHQAELAGVGLRELFAEDPARGEELVTEVGDLYVDWSKHRLTRRTVGLLADLARAADVEGLRDAMFAGEAINLTEDRAVLHVALRARRGTVVEVDGHDVVPEVHEVLDAMAAFATAVRSGERRGATG
jgi:glucose-6-phosphate isomerase